MTRVSARPLVSALCLALAASPVSASFHLMQIEQVIGGVCGRVDQQAIQLRMRSSFQNAVSGHDLGAFDAAGTNRVLLLDTPGNVTNHGIGVRILFATAAFTAAGNGPAPDFVLASPIPAAYLAAGKVTFEDFVGTPVWALAWGGAAYTGTNTGTIDNDADGNFNPPFGGMLPWWSGQALRFQGTASAPSTNNAADYLVTAGDATFTNNAGTSALVAGDCVFGDGFETDGFEGWDAISPP